MSTLKLGLDSMETVQTSAAAQGNPFPHEILEDMYQGSVGQLAVIDDFFRAYGGNLTRDQILALIQSIRQMGNMLDQVQEALFTIHRTNAQNLVNLAIPTP